MVGLCLPLPITASGVCEVWVVSLCSVGVVPSLRLESVGEKICTMQNNGWAARGRLNFCRSSVQIVRSDWNFPPVLRQIPRSKFVRGIF